MRAVALQDLQERSVTCVEMGRHVLRASVTVRLGLPANSVKGAVSSRAANVP